MFKSLAIISITCLLLSTLSFSQDSAPLCDSATDTSVVRIHKVQGDSGESPMKDKDGIILQGLVTKKVTELGGYKEGVYIQEPSTLEDDNPATSEGIFIQLSQPVINTLRENDLNTENANNRIVLEQGDADVDGAICYYPEFDHYNFPCETGEPTKSCRFKSFELFY